MTTSHDDTSHKNTAAKRIVIAAWLLHGTRVGEEAGERNLVFFRVKWLQAAMKGTSCVRRLRFGSFQRVIGSPLVFCNAGMRIAL